MGAQKRSSSASRVIEHCTARPQTCETKVTSFPSEETKPSAARVLSMVQSVGSEGGKYFKSGTWVEARSLVPRQLSVRIPENTVLRPSHKPRHDRQDDQEGE